MPHFVNTDDDCRPSPRIDLERQAWMSLQNRWLETPLAAFFKRTVGWHGHILPRMSDTTLADFRDRPMPSWHRWMLTNTEYTPKVRRLLDMTDRMTPRELEMFQAIVRKAYESEREFQAVQAARLGTDLEMASIVEIADIEAEQLSFPVAFTDIETVCNNIAPPVEDTTP